MDIADDWRQQFNLDLYVQTYDAAWCPNIHGHDYNGVEAYAEGCKHLNLAANVCEYTPVSLGKLIKEGILSDISSIHRETIDRAAERKKVKKTFSDDVQSVSGNLKNIEERSEPE